MHVQLQLPTVRDSDAGGASNEAIEAGRLRGYILKLQEGMDIQGWLHDKRLRRVRSEIDDRGCWRAEAPPGRDGVACCEPDLDAVREQLRMALGDS